MNHRSDVNCLFKEVVFGIGKPRQDTADLTAAARSGIMIS